MLKILIDHITLIVNSSVRTKDVFSEYTLYLLNIWMYHGVSMSNKFTFH